MDSDKKDAPKEDNQESKDSAQQAPADALSRTPEELNEEEQLREEASDRKPEDDGAKKVSPIRALFRKINVYLLAFLLILALAIIISVVLYFNSTKTPVQPDVASQELTQDALKQLANTDASVGNSSQTLTIQGNAVVAGQTLMRGNLNVAGNLQTGGSIQGPSLTISGQSNLGATQINSLQVASTVAIQGNTTLRNLNVAGTSSFSGAITASQITVTKLILSGSGMLDIPNHLSFTGPTPIRTIGNGLGSGGSASLDGSDTSGTINVNTGNNTVAGCLVQVTFRQAFPSTPRVIISPVGASAGKTQYYTTRTSTGFSICSANAAPENKSFAYDYFVVGK